MGLLFGVWAVKKLCRGFASDDESEHHSHHDMIHAAVALQPSLFIFQSFLVFKTILGFGGYTFTRPCLGLEGASAVAGLCYPLIVVVGGGGRGGRAKLLRICFSIDTM
jgi:hypothetical protein